MKTLTSKYEYVKSVFGSGAMARNGVNVAVTCPECGKGTKKKKLSINLETWQYHCWVCGTKGKSLSYLLKKNFGSEEEEYYRRNFDSDHKDFKISIPKEEDVRLPSGFSLLLRESNLSHDPDFRACLGYLKSRGIGKEIVWRYGIGTCTYGKFRRRVIIPSFDEYGDLNYFTGRSIDDVFPKYLNSKNDRREIVFNDINIDWSQEITLVEGPFDLLNCDKNSTCLLGSNLNESYLLFKKLVSHKSSVVIAMDSDAVSKAYKIASLLSSYCCSVRVADLGGYRDVGEMSHSDFLNIKKSAKQFSSKDRLLNKIYSLGSGSII